MSRYTGGGGYLPLVSVDPATTAWVNAVIANGGSVSTGRRTIVNNLIVGLKADGLFSKLDRLWLFAAENVPSALTDLIGLVLATAVNTPTFTADDGYAGISTGYIDGNTNPSLGGFNATATESSYFGWAFSSGTDLGAFIGSKPTATQPMRIYPKFTDGNCYWRCQNDVGDFVTAVADMQGLTHVTQTGATAKTVYRNGSFVASGSQTEASPTGIILVCNDTNGIDFFRSICSCGGMAGFLSATEVANFYARIRTYMTAVGVP